MSRVEDDLDIEELDSLAPPAAASAPFAAASMPGQMPIVRYLVSRNAPFYRLILDVLLDEESRLGLHLPTVEVAAQFRSRIAIDPDLDGELPVVEDLLGQLHAWGNVDRIHNTHRKGTYQEYLQKDYLYQLTPAGAQVHRYLTRVDAELGAAGALQSAMLPEVLAALRELANQLNSSVVSSPRAVYAALQRVYNGFEQLSENAKLFIQGLNRALELDTALEVEAFLEYKQVVVEYLQTFVLGLMRYADPISSAIREAEQAGVTEQFAAAARVEAAPTLGMSLPAVIERDAGQLRDRWSGLRQWFFATDNRAAVATTLQDRAIDAVNRIVSIVRRLNEQRFNRVDRKADLLTLARWFSGMDDPIRRARLWRDAFGLYSARHLGAPHPAELDFDRRPRESWWDTQAAPIDVRIRTQGPRATRGRPQTVRDPSDMKARLALKQQEADRIVESAVRLLTRRGPVRLSELPALSAAEFTFVLGCLHIALSSRNRSARTSDGRLAVSIRATRRADGIPTVAVLHTEHGRLAVIDYELTVRDLRAERPT